MAFAVPAADVRDQLQATLGDAYYIERELTPGGMSRLFLATERSLDRKVVIKLLPPEYASEVSAARFQREVTLTAHLQHPHILPILSAGAKGGLLYYIMPYVEGESLRQRLDREGKLPVAAAVQILREVTDALSRAHKSGIVHRDIKPENILLQDDHAMLADFGVARALHDATGNERLTEAGMGLGTPGYMAPEQLAGDHNVDARADVYAVAVVGYEMLAGTGPFAGATPQAIAAAHFSTVPKPLSLLRPGVPRPTADAIAKALANAPADRFATAAEFRDALTNTAGAPRSRAATVGRWAGVVALLFAAGVAGVLGWRRFQHRDAPAAGGQLWLAVLPFDNLGDPGDAYFAEGMTDAVRGKLTSIPGLDVIAPGSSDLYRKTTKTPAEIGQELGVRYLLVGKVRWAKAAGTPGRVQVSPALIEVSSGADRWEHSFDASLTDVFQVQADIASQVAGELGLVLTHGVAEGLGTRPTRNAEAYDAFLRAQAESGEPFEADPATLLRSIPLYKKAVTLDSTFALGWAWLGQVYAMRQAFSTPSRATQDSARAAFGRAFTLDSTLADVYLARAEYLTMIDGDVNLGREAAQTGLRIAPSNVALTTLLGTAQARLGQWQAAIATYERALQLDPKSSNTWDQLGGIYRLLGRYDLAGQAFNRALALNPSNSNVAIDRVLLALAQGDVAGARAALHAGDPSGQLDRLVDATNLYDLGWLLDSSEKRKVISSPVSAFGGDRASWLLTIADQYAAMGNAALAKTYADSAIPLYETALNQAAPANIWAQSSTRAYLGFALAYAGRPAEALAEAQRAVALHPIEFDRNFGPFTETVVARLFLLLGKPNEALDALAANFAVPSFLTARLIRADPAYAPLRGNPRFEQLLGRATAGEKKAS